MVKTTTVLMMVVAGYCLAVIRASDEVEGESSIMTSGEVKTLFEKRADAEFRIVEKRESESEPEKPQKRQNPFFIPEKRGAAFNAHPVQVSQQASQVHEVRKREVEVAPTPSANKGKQGGIFGPLGLFKLKNQAPNGEVGAKEKRRGGRKLVTGGKKSSGGHEDKKHEE